MRQVLDVSFAINESNGELVGVEATELLENSASHDIFNIFIQILFLVLFPVKIVHESIRGNIGFGSDIYIFFLEHISGNCPRCWRYNGTKKRSKKDIRVAPHGT